MTTTTWTTTMTPSINLQARQWRILCTQGASEEQKTKAVSSSLDAYIATRSRKVIMRCLVRAVSNAKQSSKTLNPQLIQIGLDN